MIKLYECINNLYAVFDYPLNKITPNHHCYQDLIYVKNYSHNDIYIETLQSMSHPTQLIPGSVGEYLWGKVQNNYGQIISYCSPSYINSHGEIDKDCEYQIWIQYDKRFECINNNNNSHAYVILNKSDNHFISTKNAQIMKNNGVYTFDLLKSKLRKYYFIEKDLNINQFIYEEKKDNIKESDQRQIITILIIITIIFIILRCVI